MTRLPKLHFETRNEQVTYLRQRSDTRHDDQLVNATRSYHLPDNWFEQLITQAYTAKTSTCMASLLSVHPDPSSRRFATLLRHWVELVATRKHESISQLGHRRRKKERKADLEQNLKNAVRDFILMCDHPVHVMLKLMFALRQPYDTEDISIESVALQALRQKVAAQLEHLAVDVLRECHDELAYDLLTLELNAEERSSTLFAITLQTRCEAMVEMAYFKNKYEKMWYEGSSNGNSMFKSTKNEYLSERNLLPKTSATFLFYNCVRKAWSKPAYLLSTCLFIILLVFLLIIAAMILAAEMSYSIFILSVTGQILKSGKTEPFYKADRYKTRIEAFLSKWLPQWWIWLNSVLFKWWAWNGGRFVFIFILGVVASVGPEGDLETMTSAEIKEHRTMASVEMLMYVWVAGTTLGLWEQLEILGYNLDEFCQSRNNVLDAVSCSLFFVAGVMRTIAYYDESDDAVEVCSLLLAVASFFTTMNLLTICTFSEQLGPMW